MQIEIDKAKVERGVSAVLRELNGMPFGELILTLSEALGRSVVHFSDTPIQMAGAVDIIKQHIETTVIVGGKNKGF